MLAAVKQKGDLLEYTSDELKADVELVRIALGTMSAGVKKALTLRKQNPIVKAIAKEDKEATASKRGGK